MSKDDGRGRKFTRAADMPEEPLSCYRAKPDKQRHAAALPDGRKR
jgi:hypothetical protein